MKTRNEVPKVPNTKAARNHGTKAVLLFAEQQENIGPKSTSEIIIFA